MEQSKEQPVIQVNEEGQKLIIALADGYTRYHGIQSIRLANNVLENIKLIEAKPEAKE